jgi:thiamine-monophosphate kinase
VLSENALVRHLQQRFGGKSAQLKLGIGDDAAVIHPKNADEYWVITTDMLLENVDFRSGWLSPAELGHKSLAVNLSDIAAMGARPRFYTVSIAIPDRISKNWVTRFYQGMNRLGNAHGAILIGGDLSRSVDGFQICICALGETSGRRVVLRSGGKAGDRIFVTGTLGKSAAGLVLLFSGQLRGRTAREREALRAHKMPEPKCDAGLWLATEGFASSMIDLSDGLSMDLHRLCRASGTGARLEMISIPVFRAPWIADPPGTAVKGGEDFELLFTVRPKLAESLLKRYPAGFPPISEIGSLTRERGIRITQPDGRVKPLRETGFDHFRRP